MTTSRACVLLGLLALCADGCELPRDQGKPATATTVREPVDDDPQMPSSDPADQTSPATTAPKTPSTWVKRLGETAPATKKDEQPPLAPIDTRTVEGTVRAIDARRRLISINVGKQSQTFAVDAAAPIENLGDDAHVLKGGLAGIRPGASVLLVIYRNKSDKEVVSLIRVKATAMKK
jgi:hypothetical protein